ncbi:hypothetical protein EH802P2_00080 [Enterococcus phage EH802P2]|nr:hypothetical protein EH802P1_00019 [Enterococcus phage EH802P1]WAX16185.1 hypothetical protein EH802P2_00080 [Enterococcus phage EH802P2]
MRVSLRKVINNLQAYRNIYCTLDELKGLNKAIELLENELNERKAHKELFKKQGGKMYEHCAKDL